MSRQTRHPVFFAAVFCAVIPAIGAAQAPSLNTSVQPSGVQRVIRDQLAGSINEPGLQNTLEVSWIRPLSRSDHPLLADAHVSAGLVSVTTPSAARLGGWVEYSPLSILDVRAGIEPGVYFGAFSSLLSFGAYTDPYDRQTRNARHDLKSGTGLRSYVEPAVKLKAGPFVARVGAEFERWSSSAAGPLFYEPTRDTLLKAKGDYMMTLTSVAMYQRAGVSGGLVGAGVIHGITRVLDAPAGNRSERLGLIGFRELGSPLLGLAHVRVTAVAWRYLEDPSKRDQWGAALLIGFRTGK